MTDKPKKNKAKFHTPQNSLRLKAGYGGIDPKVMDRAEEYIEKNDVDFTDIAKSILERLDKAVEAIRRDGHGSKEDINRMVAPIMEMKANGAMFKYGLLSDVADIILDFLENAENLDDDALAIVDIHRKTFAIIINGRLKGTGGVQGDVLIKELDDACARYHKKHSKNKA